MVVFDFCKACGLSIRSAWSADISKTAHAFQQQNDSDADHSFLEVRAATQGVGFRRRHRKECDIRKGPKIDLFECGFPCKPFSTQSMARFSEKGWRKHPEAKGFFQTIGYFKQRRPRLGVLENVIGFQMQCKHSESPALVLQHELDEVQVECAILNMDHKIWVDMSRERSICLTADQESGGKKTIRLACSLIALVEGIIKSAAPTPWCDLVLRPSEPAFVSGLADLEAIMWYPILYLFVGIGPVYYRLI